MTPTPEAPPIDAVPPLPRDVVHRVVLYFAGHLPAPPGDTADDRARRDSDALADVAALEPANARGGDAGHALRRRRHLGR
jgi:hypothetical protein